MRRRTLSFIIAFLSLALTLSIIAALPIASEDNNTIISKLEELCEKVKDEKPALENKVNAVIHQIRAGAFKSALNKLENDVKKSILACVDNPEDLIELINEIIDLIKEMITPKPTTPDFEITADPGELEIMQGGLDATVITITSKNGFSEEIILTGATLVSGLTLSFDPSAVTPPANGSVESSLQVHVASDVNPDEYKIIATGTCDALEHNLVISLKVLAVTPPPTPDFSIMTAPTVLTIQQGNSNISVITITSIQGFNQPVDLAVISDPVIGVTATLKPSQVVPQANSFAISVLSVNVAIDAFPGSNTLAINGNSSAMTHSATISYEVTVPQVPPTPDFSVLASPDILIAEQGDSVAALIIVVSQNGFSQQVDLAVASESIPSVSTSIDPSQVIPESNGFITSMLSVSLENTATPNDYLITIAATSRDLTRTVSVLLRVIVERTPPEIINVLRLPEQPNYNESVLVMASLTDFGTGVKQVILNYSTGEEWTSVNMALNEGLYKASIPAFPFNTTIQYRIFAIDNANNRALSNLYSFKVIDPYPPLLKIDRPIQGSYVSGKVEISVFMNDQDSGRESGLAGGEMFINDTVVKTWESPASSESNVYVWNTIAFGSDGVYIVKLKAFDKAGNIAEKDLSVMVDNTLPIAIVNTPVNGSYLRSSVLIKMICNDANFDKMEARIDGTLARISTTSGSEVFEWNTTNYYDGIHTITLTVFDKAGNRRQASVNVTVDNTPPSIGAPSWSPKEPEANIDIQINVTISEFTYESGIKNVTLWFKNKTLEESHFISMEFEDGNWTATLTNQTDSDIKFFIEAFDRAENHAETSEIYEIRVKGVTGLSLDRILMLTLIFMVAIGLLTYLVLRRRRARGGSVASPSAKPTSQPPSKPLAPPSTPLEKPRETVAENYGMVSFIIPAYNEENTISHRIASAFDRAASRKGPSEIIIVDDGSEDGTHEMAWDAVKQNRRKYPNISAKVVRHSAKLGKAEAVLTARNRAWGEVITTINGNPHIT